MVYSAHPWQSDFVAFVAFFRRIRCLSDVSEKFVRVVLPLTVVSGTEFLKSVGSLSAFVSIKKEENTVSRRDALERLQNRLLAQRLSLRGKLDEDLGQAEVADDGINDVGEAALQDERMELHSQLAAFESRGLEQIDQAIAAIRNGKYGDCVRCDKPIPIARLEALPFSLSCVECQRRTEISGIDDDEDWAARMGTPMAAVASPPVAAVAVATTTKTVKISPVVSATSPKSKSVSRPVATTPAATKSAAKSRTVTASGKSAVGTKPSATKPGVKASATKPSSKSAVVKASAAKPAAAKSRATAVSAQKASTGRGASASASAKKESAARSQAGKQVSKKSPQASAKRR